MATRDIVRPSAAALLLMVSSSGCYAAHERSSTGTDSSTPPSSADPAYLTSATTRDEPSAPGCGTSQWAPLAPPGFEGLRLPTIVSIDGGFVASVVHRNPAYGYPTAVARMRSDLTDMLDAPRDAGIVTSEGGVVSRPAMVAGGDGRIASCAVGHTTDSLERVPGGVAFFDRAGVLERVVRLADGCSDVAWIDGRWVALEVTPGDGLYVPSDLVVFDDALAIARRIPLGYRSNRSSFAARVVGLNGRAIVVSPALDGPVMVAVDLDTADVQARPFPFAPPVDLVASQLVLVTLGDRLGVAWIAAGGAWWTTFDDVLVPVDDPIRLGDAPEYISYIDATPLDEGVVVAWAADGLVLALIDDDGAATLARAVLPASVTGLIETLEIAAQGDVVAVALHVDDPAAARSSVGVWSSRCRAR